MDTTFKTSEGVFNYRVGAIILNGTKALMALACKAFRF